MIAPLRSLLFASLIVAPALAVTPAHTGVPRVRTGPEASDIALFVAAAVGVGLVRRGLRVRFARQRDRTMLRSTDDDARRAED